MRLSELVVRCDGHDPILMIEDDCGMPRPVESTDIGVMLDHGQPKTYVLLERGGDE